MPLLIAFAIVVVVVVAAAAAAAVVVINNLFSPVILGVHLLVSPDLNKKSK